MKRRKREKKRWRKSLLPWLSARMSGTLEMLNSFFKWTNNFEFTLQFLSWYCFHHIVKACSHCGGIYILLHDWTTRIINAVGTRVRTSCQSITRFSKVTTEVNTIGGNRNARNVDKTVGWALGTLPIVTPFHIWPRGSEIKHQIRKLFWKLQKRGLRVTSMSFLPPRNILEALWWKLWLSRSSFLSVLYSQMWWTACRPTTWSWRSWSTST